MPRGMYKRQTKKQKRAAAAREGRGDIALGAPMQNPKRWALKQLLKKQGGACAICGEQMDLGKYPSFRRATLDHIKPTSKGGTDKLTNLQAVCYACNQAKAADFEAKRTPRSLSRSFEYDDTRLRIRRLRAKTLENEARMNDLDTKWRKARDDVRDLELILGQYKNQNQQWRDEVERRKERIEELNEEKTQLTTLLTEALNRNAEMGAQLAGIRQHPVRRSWHRVGGLFSRVLDRIEGDR